MRSDRALFVSMRRPWQTKRVAAGAFGVLLWLQLAAGALAAELAFPDADMRRVVVYALPLVFLALFAWRRYRLIGLLLFPTSFAAVLIVAPTATSDGLGDPILFSFVALTMVAYVLVASAWLQEPEPGEAWLEVGREPLRIGHDRWRPHRGTFVSRCIVLVAAFMVTAAAVPLMPRLVDNVRAAFARPGDWAGLETGLVLCNLILFFVWCLLAYALFLAPALEVESRIRRLETQMHATLARTRSARQRVVFIVVMLAALSLMAALLLVRYL